jgi:hypothetical protein
MLVDAGASRAGVAGRSRPLHSPTGAFIPPSAETFFAFGRQPDVAVARWELQWKRLPQPGLSAWPMRSGNCRGSGACALRRIWHAESRWGVVLRGRKRWRRRRGSDWSYPRATSRPGRPPVDPRSGAVVRNAPTLSKAVAMLIHRSRLKLPTHGRRVPPAACGRAVVTLTVLSSIRLS